VDWVGLLAQRRGAQPDGYSDVEIEQNAELLLTPSAFANIQDLLLKGGSTHRENDKSLE
jgi:hypothetical protein